MNQKFNLKSYIYFVFFILKGFKVYKEGNNTYLVDPKRSILISQLPKNESTFSFSLRGKKVEIKNPGREGFCVVKNYSPYLCVLFT